VADPQLAAVVKAWASLSVPLRAAVLAMIHAADANEAFPS
jgi:hypothetical protein